MHERLKKVGTKAARVSVSKHREALAAALQQQETFEAALAAVATHPWLWPDDGPPATAKFNPDWWVDGHARGGPPLDPQKRERQRTRYHGADHKEVYGASGEKHIYHGVLGGPGR